MGQGLGIKAPVREGPHSVGQGRNPDFPDSSEVLTPRGQRAESRLDQVRFQNWWKVTDIKRDGTAGPKDVIAEGWRPAQGTQEWECLSGLRLHPVSKKSEQNPQFRQKYPWSGGSGPLRPPFPSLLTLAHQVRDPPRPHTHTRASEQECCQRQQPR